MTKTQKLFFSCVDSRIEDQGSMYARFHLGTFFRGQALTFANALRRTLLSEIPGLIITDVVIQGATHEFATLPGIEETVLDILLNLKKIVFAPYQTNLTNFQATGFLQSRGPGKVTAADLKLPACVKCIEPNIHIATLTNGAELELRFNLEIRSPHNLVPSQSSTSRLRNSHSQTHNSESQLVFDTIPMPVQKVNYVIKGLNAKQGSEYIVLEVWTNGSLLPQDTLQFALKNLTNLFFQFADRSKKIVLN